MWSVGMGGRVGVGCELFANHKKFYVFSSRNDAPTSCRAILRVLMAELRFPCRWRKGFSKRLPLLLPCQSMLGKSFISLGWSGLCHGAGASLSAHFFAKLSTDIFLSPSLCSLSHLRSGDNA